MGTHVSTPSLKPPPTFFPTPSLWVVPEYLLWVPYFMCQTCTGHLYIWWDTCFSAILLNHATLVYSHLGQKPVLYICVSFAAFHIKSSLPSSLIPHICINMLYWCFSFCLTSLWIRDSSFTHLVWITFMGHFFWFSFGWSFDLRGSQTVVDTSQDLPMCVHASFS